MPKSTPRYKADIGGGELKVRESRIIAGLLLKKTNAEEWRNAIVVKNILQHKSPEFAKRQANLLRARLTLMKPALWQMVMEGSKQTATNAVFAAAIKHSALLGDFLDLVIKEELKIYSKALTTTHWKNYLEGCHGRDPLMSYWSESTESRLASSIFGILTDVGYITDKRSKLLQTVQISPEVMNYLKAENETYVLRCIQVSA